MNELETQLRSWAPRRPSAKLERQIFAERQAAADIEPVFRLRWLAPAAVALVMMCVMFNQRNNPAFSGSSSSGSMVALIMSNQSVAAYLPSSFQPEQNALPAETFEWTNGSEVTFRPTLFLPRRGSR
jgi:hypothetical protein